MICPICQKEAYCTFAMFNEVPFIDGKKYENICFCCASIPNTFQYDEIVDRLDVYHNYSNLHINTAAQLKEQGWTESDIKDSLNAVLKLIGKPFQINASDVFECIVMLENEPLGLVTGQ
jgi:hypothetical protein